MLPVNMTTGSVASAGVTRIVSRTSQPSIFGMPISKRRSCGRDVLA